MKRFAFLHEKVQGGYGPGGVLYCFGDFFWN